MVPAPPVRLAARRLARLRARLRETGYIHERLVERLGVVYKSYHPDNRGNAAAVAAYLRERPADALDALVRLFFLSEPVDLAALESLLETADVALLEDAGLLRRVSPAAMAAELCLFECRGFYFVTDSLRKRRGTDFNNVAPLLPECHDFAAATQRRPCEKTLDLCTGSGVHALLASRHSAEVVGVDVNDRAVVFADFNKALNAADNVAFVAGDLYEPLAGARFDLVLANPPYVPDLEHEPGESYYSGGADGEAVSSRILAGLGEHLRAGGLFQSVLVMVDWPGDRFRDRVLRHLGDSAERFRAVVLSREIELDNDLVTGAARVGYGLLAIEEDPSRGGEIVEGPFEEPFGAALRELGSGSRSETTETDRGGGKSTETAATVRQERPQALETPGIAERRRSRTSATR